MAGNDGVWSETSLPLHPTEKWKLKTRQREGERQGVFVEGKGDLSVRTGEDGTVELITE